MVGNMNEMIKTIMRDFTAIFAPNAECLYLCDVDVNLSSINVDKLKELGFDMAQDDKIPDAVLYRRDKDWLYLIESVTNGGVIDEVRLEELETLTKNVDKQKVFVTAFPNSQSFKDNLVRLAWDTVAWIADAPEHMIHFEKHGTLEPR